MDFLLKVYVCVSNKFNNTRGEFGVGSILSIAVALIVSAFVLVPGMRSFATKITQGMSDWWDDSIETLIFPGK